MAVPTRETFVTPAVREYCDTLIADVATLRMPELFAPPHPEAIHSVNNRNGVTVIAIRSTSLSEHQIVQILRWRLAQYIAVRFVDLARVYETRMTREPRENAGPGDIHIIAGSAETGEILGYSTIKAPLRVAPSTTMREVARPLFNTERTFGWGILNRLRIVPDLPVIKVRELERYVKNQQLPLNSHLSFRAPIEIGVAVLRTVTGPLRMEIDLILNEIEDAVAGRNLAFFHMPLVIIRNVAAFAPLDAYLLWRFQYQPVVPYAVLVSDVASILNSRLPAIEAALERPGNECLAALAALHGEQPRQESSLTPDLKLVPLIDTPPAYDTSMEDRKQLFVLGDALRKMPLLRSLTAAEATLLGSMLERVELAEGAAMSADDPAGDVYLVESGHADLCSPVGTDGTREIEQLGPGDFFGEIGLFEQGAPSGIVRARSRLRLLRVPNRVYRRYLDPLVEVREQLATTGLRRLAVMLNGHLERD